MKIREILPMAREIVPGIFEIDTKPMGQEQLVASFLVKGDDRTALIDTGFPLSAGTVADEIEKINTNPGKIDYIILTHTHIDHAGAAGRLAQIAENAKIIVHKRGVFNLKNSGKISSGARMVFGTELSEKLGDTIDIPGHRIFPVTDNDSIDLGGKKILVYCTPAHSGDHISLFEEATGTLFPGDTACLHYPQLSHVLIPAGSPPVYHAEYIVEELQKFSTLRIRKILTPHFGDVGLEAPIFIASNIKSVKQTRGKIEKMLVDGLEFPQVVEKLRADIIQDSGNSRAAIPDFLADVWLRIMLKTGLMGYMADILQYARVIHPFVKT